MTSSSETRRRRRRGPLAEAHDAPLMERFRTPRARRGLIAVHVLLTLILVTVPEWLYVWSQDDQTIPRWAFAAAALILGIPWAFVTGMVNGSVSGIFDLASDQLDELERCDRDAAYRTAYRLLIPITMVTWGAVAGLSAAGHEALAFWGLSVLLFTQLGLPQYIAAWRLAARQDAGVVSDEPTGHGA